MKLRLTILFLIGGLMLCMALWLRSTTQDSHQQMQSMLIEVQSRTPYENLFLGDADYRQATDKLATANTTSDQIASLWSRAPKALRLGKTDEAIADYERVRSLMSQVGNSMGEAKLREFEVDLHYALAIAYMRKGETENCVHCRTGESCILPIRGTGLHKQQNGSKQAIENLLTVLDRSPDHLPARWLLNIAHMTLGTYPDAIPAPFLIPSKVFESEMSFPKFNNIAADVGLDTFGLAGGTIIDDFDGDHLLDIIVSDWNVTAELRYFKNNGDGTFTERGHEAGFAGIFGGLQIRQVDYDNDNDLDILVLRGGWMEVGSLCPNSLLENNGRGEFRDVTLKAGLGDIHLPTQTAEWADFDNDGLVDLYIGNEKSPNQLFKNQGGGRFVDIATSAGVADSSFTKGVSWGDFDNDRFPDIYVSNLNGPNRLFRNNHDGTFRDVANELNVAGPHASFPVWFWDFNNDGVLDIFVGGYDLSEGIQGFVADTLCIPNKAERDQLYQGDGHGGFTNVSESTGVARVTLPMGSNFGDMDGDGFLDYYLGTGYIDYDALIPNRAFLNRGGKRFQDVSAAAGLSHLQKGHGVAFADIDQDGDNDIFIVLGGAYPGDGFTRALFQNPGFGNHWITIKSVGTITNRGAIGARIRVVVDDHGTQRSIYRTVNSGGSFGGNPLRQHIGIGAAEKIELIEVSWPTSNSVQEFRNVAIDQFIEITEGKSNFRQLPYKSFQMPKSSSMIYQGASAGN